MARSRSSSKTPSTSRDSTPLREKRAVSSKTSLSSSASSRSRSSSRIRSPSSHRAGKYLSSYRRNPRISVARRSQRDTERKRSRENTSARFPLKSKLDHPVSNTRNPSFKTRHDEYNSSRREFIGRRSIMENMDKSIATRESSKTTLISNTKNDSVSSKKELEEKVQENKETSTQPLVSKDRMMKATSFPSVDRSIVPPFLLRVFLKINGEHDITEFATRQKEPVQDEIQIYAWMDARLRELVNLAKEVCEETRERNAVWKFRLIYPDKQGHNMMLPIGQVHSTRVDNREDKKTLQQVKFQIGDYIDISIIVQYTKTNMQSITTSTIEKPGATQPPAQVDGFIAKNTAEIVKDQNAAIEQECHTVPENNLQEFDKVS